MSDSLDTGAARPTAHAAITPGSIGRAWSAVLGRLLRLSIDETRVARRGFDVDDPEVVDRLEAIGASFVCGYNHAVGCTDLPAMVRALDRSALADSGFVYEGAAMGLALSDWMTPGRRWFDRFVQGPADHHEYMAWVGFGWSFARLPVSPMRALARYRSLSRWLALDGYGFHEGYFGWRRTVIRHWRPRSMTGAAAQVFDQGLGRSLWFVFGARPERVARSIATFPGSRQPDLWAGVGLAAAYAGSTSPAKLLELRHLPGRNFSAFAQGVVFAAEARRRAGNPVPHTELACDTLLGMPLDGAADIAIDCIPATGHDIATYQQWRATVQQRF